MALTAVNPHHRARAARIGVTIEAMDGSKPPRALRRTASSSAIAGLIAYAALRALVDRQPEPGGAGALRGPVPQLLPLAAGFAAAVIVRVAGARYGPSSASSTSGGAGSRSVSAQ